MSGRLRVSVIALSAAPLLCGCLSSPQTSDTGVRIGDETLKQFEAGVTTEAWLVAILGEPTSWAIVEGVEDTRVYRYATGEQSSGFLASLAGSASRNTSVVYFIVTRGTVTRFWADRAQQRTLLGGKADAPSGEKQAPAQIN